MNMEGRSLRVHPDILNSRVSHSPVRYWGERLDDDEEGCWRPSKRLFSQAYLEYQGHSWTLPYYIIGARMHGIRIVLYPNKGCVPESFYQNSLDFITVCTNGVCPGIAIPSLLNQHVPCLILEDDIPLNFEAIPLEFPGFFSFQCA